MLSLHTTSFLPSAAVDEERKEKGCLEEEEIGSEGRGGGGEGK